MTQIKKTLNAVAQAIFDKKGTNIIVLDVRGISTMTDYYIIAEGTVDRHVKSLSRSIKDQMKLLNWECLHIDGDDGEWTVMDFGEFVIHLLIPEMREKYSLEELWQKAKIVDVDIVI
jgi:ribosome-associated protein